MRWYIVKKEQQFQNLVHFLLKRTLVWQKYEKHHTPNTEPHSGISWCQRSRTRWFSSVMKISRKAFQSTKFLAHKHEVQSFSNICLRFTVISDQIFAKLKFLKPLNPIKIQKIIGSFVNWLQCVENRSKKCWSDLLWKMTRFYVILHSNIMHFFRNWQADFLKILPKLFSWERFI